MKLAITDDFETAINDHIWLDRIGLNQLSEEQYREYIARTFTLENGTSIRLCRGADGDFAPGFVANLTQMDELIEYLAGLRRRMSLTNKVSG